MEIIETDATINHEIQVYLERIHFSADGVPTSFAPTLPLLESLHEAHMLAVPFENLSIHYDQPIILREELLYDKIVRRRRGGFCYEMNGLFARLLRALGYDASLLSARVAQDSGDYTPEYDHMTLLVQQVEGDDWLADVGFGDSFRRPLRLEADIAQDGADGHRYRLQHEDDYWTVEQETGAGWRPQYRFTLQPHPLADFEERCDFQQYSPESHFRQGRVCSLATPDGRITLSELRFITTSDGQRDERDLASEQEYRETLAERFDVVV
jgi:N-hydroxyarylamine O-acetyltransferase